MNKLLLGSFAVALTLSGSAAIAADMPVKAPVQVWSWTGCYVCVEGGGKWACSRQDGINVGGFIPGAGPIGNGFTPFYNVSGGIVGGTVGCNMQFNNYWVFGVESDFSWSSAQGSSAETGPLGVFLGTTAFNDQTRQLWLSTSRARVGWTWWDHAMVYVTGGWAAGRIRDSITVPPGFFAVGGGTFDDTHVEYGWTVGAGFEYAFWYNWSFKAEYLYVRLENTSFQFFGTPLFPAFTRGALNIDEHIARVGLNWRFSDCVFFECAAPAPRIYK
jgi:outer membrane immunogenic protein